MMNAVHEIGAAICYYLSFIPVDHPVYLFIDNAGGHGKKNIKKEYETILMDKYKVIVE